jgi:hypothetical protein
MNTGVRARDRIATTGGKRLSKTGVESRTRRSKSRVDVRRGPWARDRRDRQLGEPRPKLMICERPCLLSDLKDAKRRETVEGRRQGHDPVFVEEFPFPRWRPGRRVDISWPPVTWGERAPPPLPRVAQLGDVSVSLFPFRSRCFRVSVRAVLDRGPLSPERTSSPK